mmetsp:Transcript_42768/g.74275  ORF Transcript_42768/g.74275 Transcript_42768/m.74275 type:complete len:107 (-) Transcript_42768:315-635(-)
MMSLRGPGRRARAVHTAAAAAAAALRGAERQRPAGPPTLLADPKMFLLFWCYSSSSFGDRDPTLCSSLIPLRQPGRKRLHSLTPQEEDQGALSLPICLAGQAKEPA